MSSEKARKENDMTFAIVARDKKLGVCELPLTPAHISALVDIFYMMEEEQWELYKLNKIDNEVRELASIASHLCHDIKDGGKMYAFKTQRLIKKRWYMIKEPEWSIAQK